jgi:hypothetical protein
MGHGSRKRTNPHYFLLQDTTQMTFSENGIVSENSLIEVLKTANKTECPGNVQCSIVDILHVYSTCSWSGVLSHVRTCLFVRQIITNFGEIAGVEYFSSPRLVSFILLIAILTLKSYSVMVCKTFFLGFQSLIAYLLDLKKQIGFCCPSYVHLSSLVPLLDRVLV